VSDGRHGKDEATSIVVWLQAKIERLTADRDRLARDLAERERLDQVTFAADSLPAAAGDQTGPIARVQGPRAAAHRVPREARWLKVVPGFAVLAGLRAAMKASGPALSHPVRHLAAASIPVKVTAAVSVGALTVAGAVAVAPHSPIAQVLGAAPAVPASGIYSATPIPVPSSSLRLIGSIARQGLPGLDARTAAGSNPALTPPPYYYAPPVSSQPSPSSPPSQSAAPAPAAVPATLNPVTGADPDGTINLSGGGTVTLTVSASGNSGWTSWRVDAHRGVDLDFSKTSGVLQAGATDQVVVSVDPVQATDGNQQETFTIGNQQITATLPAPVPVVAPTDAAPTDTPADVPSPASS